MAPSVKASPSCTRERAFTDKDGNDGNQKQWVEVLENYEAAATRTKTDPIRHGGARRLENKR